MPSTLPDPRDGFAQRLQNLDTGFATLTVVGSGRGPADTRNDAPVNSFAAVAMDDQTAFGWGRSLYLATTIGSLAALRLAGGLLLALAPLFAGLMLFDLTRGIFSGWLRGLALVALGSLGMTVLLSVQLAVTEPWLADVVQRRTSGLPTPTAPTEMLALTLAFAIATASVLFVLGKVAFQQALSAGRPALARIAAERATREPAQTVQSSRTLMPVHSRAVAISESVAASVRRETVTADRARSIGALVTSPAAGPAGRAAPAEPLGSGYRRTSRRDARSQRTRDERP